MSWTTAPSAAWCWQRPFCQVSERESLFPSNFGNLLLRKRTPSLNATEKFHLNGLNMRNTYLIRYLSKEELSFKQTHTHTSLKMAFAGSALLEPRTEAPTTRPGEGVYEEQRGGLILQRGPHTHRSTSSVTHQAAGSCAEGSPRAQHGAAHKPRLRDNVHQEIPRLVSCQQPYLVNTPGNICPPRTGTGAGVGR